MNPKTKYKEVKKQPIIKQKTDCIVKILCAINASAMEIAAVALFLIGQYWLNGLIVMIGGIALFSLAFGFREIEFYFKSITIHLRR